MHLLIKKCDFGALLWIAKLARFHLFHSVSLRYAFVEQRKNSSHNPLQVESDAMCVKISPDSKYVAVALLDYTVKIYNMASLKFFLSLYLLDR